MKSSVRRAIELFETAKSAGQSLVTVLADNILSLVAWVRLWTRLQVTDLLDWLRAIEEECNSPLDNSRRLWYTVYSDFCTVYGAKWGG